MDKELPYFHIGHALGGNQGWFPDYAMREGGCGAVTASDVSIYLDKYKGTHLYPYDAKHVTKQDYLRFAETEMQPYLHPRINGIDTLQLYIDGFAAYLHDHGNTNVELAPWDGANSVKDTKEIIKQQIDAGFPIPNLTLYHKNPNMRYYVWHWYILGGYQEFQDTFLVKIITYGSWHWMDLNILWQTGYNRKGGLILLSMK